MQQFRELAKWAVDAIPFPKRKRRSRTGDTAGAFALSAGKATRRDKLKAIYGHVVDHVTPVWDAVEWLRLWEPTGYESDMIGMDHYQDVSAAEFDHDFMLPETYHQSSGLFPEP